MSLRSSNSRRALHFDASLDDFEDLDYEPDGFDDSNIDEDLLIQHEQESVSNATSVPAPNHRSFDTSSDVSDRTMSISSINNFRSNMNYKSMHVGVGKDSFRNNYVSYMNSTGIQHLDSSDDESELQFSDSEPTEGLSVNTDTSETNLEVENYSECEQQIGSGYVSPESPIDSLYAEENSYSDDSFLVSPTSIGGDNASSIDYSAKQPFGNETACSKLPLDNIKQQKPRIKASNFTITVKGNQRFCLQPEIMAPLPVAPISVPKLQRNRWYPWNLKLRRFMKNYPDIKCLRSTDDIIRFTKEESENPSVSRGSQFKIPLKRPPTKPKSSNLSVSVNSLSGVKVVNDVENIDDDIISLIGSTSISILEDGLIKSEAYSETSNLTPDPELTQMNRVAEWVDQTENLRPVIVDYKKIPTVYHGLCYNFFLTNQCTLRACKNSHSMTQGHHRKLAALANSYQFMEAYSFAKSEPNFFSKVFHVFAAIFGFRDNKDALIEIIEMILSACSADSRIEGVNTVLKHLQKCKSLSIFEDVIEYVRAKIDIKKYPILGEILIEIIISMENLSKNWPILRKMCNIGQRIPQKLAGKMLVNLMKYPVDHQVCREVWQHINDHKCLDLRLLPVSTKDSFLRICDPRVAVNGAMPAYQLEATIEQNLSRERDNFDRLKFSRPPPAFGQPALSQQASLRTVNSFNNNQIQPLPQALNFENLPDFASLSHQQVTFAGFELSESRPFTQLTAQPRFRQRSTSSTSSSTNINSDSDLFDQSTSQSSLINNRTGFMYNDEGLQYDPIKDYCPPNKRRKNDLSETCFYNSKPVSSDRSHSSSSLSKKEGKRLKLMRSLDVNQPSRTLEDLVTSSSEPVAKNQKAPEQPIFGKIYFDPNYEFNISLHNSYLQRIDNVDIDEEDVHTLNECVKAGDGAVFLELLHKYMVPTTVQNFISMTLAHLKGTNQIVARTYKKLLASIENKSPYYYGDLKIRVVLEVVTMNLLFEFERRAMFEEAKDVLMKFPDWDSLITSRLFITSTYTGVSIVGRYLFIARLLVNCQPELAYEILTCPKLHLLEESCNWPYHPATPIPEICEADLGNRNLVLKKFLQSGYLLNTVAVIQLYKIALKRKTEIWKFDVRPFINPMLLFLINHKKTSQLKQINAELGIFVNHLERNVLRGFLVVMSSHLSKEDRFVILEHCMIKNIYQKIVLNRCLIHVIDIKTNMSNEEIELIVLYYFHKLVELRSLPPGNRPLIFEIKLPGYQTQTNQKLLPNIFHQSRSIMDTNQYIKLVLLNKFSIIAVSEVPTVVEVPKKTLIKYLRS